MKNTFPIPWQILVFIAGCTSLYLGFREIKKHKERKKNASKFNDFGFIEDKWGYVDYEGYKYILHYFVIAIICLIAILFNS